jgi:hypothetical protein
MRAGDANHTLLSTTNLASLLVAATLWLALCCTDGALAAGADAGLAVAGVNKTDVQADHNLFKNGESELRSGVRVFVNAEDAPKSGPPGTVRLTTHCYHPVFLPGRDVCIMLEPRKMCPPGDDANRTKYVVTFKGNALTTSPGMLRLNLLGLSNEMLGVYMLVRCSEFIAKMKPGQKHHLSMCYRTGLDFDAFEYCDLMQNTVYGLAPEGRQFASYRFLEVLCGGAIPVIYTEKRRLFWPFASAFNESEWHKCVRVVRQPYEIIEMAWVYAQGDVDNVVRRQKACKHMRERVCDKDARAQMYKKDIDLAVNNQSMAHKST